MPTTHTRRQALATLAKSCAGLAILPTLSACASGGRSTLARADRSSGGTRRSSLLDKWGPGGTGGDPLPPIRNDSTPSAHHYGPGDLTGVITRDKWAQGNPVPRLMDKMQPISRITLHHDGMSVFSSTSFAAAAARVESIRSAHRQRNWGDIGYHFLIDPAGRVWQGRSTSWQGAHVKDGNVGNLGICVMGNYQSQTPTEVQLKAIEDLLYAQMKYFSIAADRVHTHQELRPTACPGRSLQPRIASIRGGRVLQSI